MKKINKININGESYDIQDNSSGYITGEEVDKFLPKGYVITTQVNTTENKETASKIWEDIKNGKPVEVWYEWSANEYRRMIGYRFFETSKYLDMYFERDNFTSTFPKDEVDLTGTYAVEITYVHNDNINNRVLLLYNRQAFLIKNNSINIATRNYVDTKFAEAIAMGYKTEVVEELPTENISHQVIYLVLNGDEEENNIYDEFVYNSNDEWEKIGSTKTDLSNYYNKQEVDEKIEEHDLGYFHVFVPEITDGYQDKEGETFAIIKNFILNEYDNSKRVHITDGNKHYYFGETSNSSSSLIMRHIGTNMNLSSSNANNIPTLIDYVLLYIYKKDGDITNIEFRDFKANYPVRPFTTEESHDIKHKYNVANKIYADVASTYDIEKYGIRFWAKTQIYEVGEILYNSSNEKFYRVIKRMVNMSSFDSSYTETLSSKEVEMLKRPHTEDIEEKFNKLTDGIVFDGVEYVSEIKQIPINYEVTNISENYGFELSEDGYYTSNNNGVRKSVALCKIVFNNDFDIELIVDYISDGYNYYNYGILGQLDQELSNNTNSDGSNGSTKVKINCKDNNSNVVNQTKYIIPAGEHFICMKYIRGSFTADEISDTLKFKFNTTQSQEVIDKFYVADKQYVDDNFLEKSKELFKTIPVDFDNITDETKSILLEPTINYIENNIPFAIYDIVRNKFLYISNKLINNSISFSYLTADTLAGTTYKGFEIWWETDESGNYSITRINTPNYRNSNWFLSVNNNNSYTPTSNYNPATKKYVDDSISSALGDVNSILATLTTVEESEVSE